MKFIGADVFNKNAIFNQNATFAGTVDMSSTLVVSGNITSGFATSTSTAQILAQTRSADNAQLVLMDGSNSNVILQRPSGTTDMSFVTGGSHRARLTSDGKFLLNLTSYTGNEDFVVNSTSNNGGILLQRSGVNAVSLSRGGTPSVGIYNSSGNQRIRFGENNSWIRDTLMIGSDQAATEKLEVTGNIKTTGNIIGDDSTNITNIAGIQCDSVLADGDGATGILLATSDVQILDGNEDTIIRVQDDQYTIGQTSSTNSSINGRVTLKNRELAKTSNAAGKADGDIIYFGSTTSMSAGRIYVYDAGTWELASSNAEATSRSILAVALGAASDTNGMLLKGMVTLAADPGTIGDPLFLSTSGGAANSAPTGSGKVVRRIGYCLDSTNAQIYFNPDNNYTVL